MSSIQVQQSSRPPRDNLVRAVPHGVELRWADDEHSGMPTLIGRFARFNEWTEIDSLFEGRFMEQIAPGAFTKTIAENVTNMRVLFQHGRDPQVGDKVLGPIESLEEDTEGPQYEVPLLDTSYNRDLLPGLEQGLYGASFRFRVMREEIEEEPKKSKHNPDGLPERTIKEAHVMEFGPVTFPAYAGATAGVRSLTDEFVFGSFTDDPAKLARIIDFTRTTHEGTNAPSEETPAQATSTPERREPTDQPKEVEKVAVDIDKLASLDDLVARLDEVKARQGELTKEYGTRAFSVEAQAEWDELKDEKRQLQDRIKPDNIYDLSWYRGNSRDEDHHLDLLRDGAMWAVEAHTFAHPRANREDAQGHIAKLLDTVDGPGQDKVAGELARRILATGSPVYKRAFGKTLQGSPLSNEEARAMSVGTGSEGGFAVVFDLDPTLVPTSNGAVNPYRASCRVVSISGTNEWRGVSSGAVVATYRAEIDEVGDNAPVLAQPAFVVQRCDAFIPFSIALGQDFGALQSELATAIQDGKDVNEATQFATGVGTTVFPQGMVTGATTTVTTGTTLVLAAADIYKTEEALGPRFRPMAQWFANRFIYNKVRQIDTAGGAQLWVPNLREGLANNPQGNTGYNLDGYQANEASAMAATLATTTKIAVLGDPRYYVIVDRVGMDLELVPHLFATANNRPSGQRGLLAYWRNTARVFDANAFRTLVAL